MWKIQGWTVVVFTHQVDCVKHLNLSYRGAAWVRQITIVVADGKSAQSCGAETQTEVKKIKTYIPKCIWTCSAGLKEWLKYSDVNVLNSSDNTGGYLFCAWIKSISFTEVTK